MKRIPDRRLTPKEIQQIAEAYQGYFPGWKVIQRDTLAREMGPVAQCITFERLSGGCYRVTGYIRVLVAPEDYWVFELPQHLEGLQRINRRQDAEIRARVVDGIRRHFRPSIDHALDPRRVLKLYEQLARPSAAEAYSLAALNAYLGYDERALHWSNRFNEISQSQEHDLARRTFLDRLVSWIRAGVAAHELRSVLDNERHKWGLAHPR